MGQNLLHFKITGTSCGLKQKTGVLDKNNSFFENMIQNLKKTHSSGSRYSSSSGIWGEEGGRSVRAVMC